ncbi:MAG: VWA domain-containing protein [Candidatus Micrarchaeaceae archaeon]
MNSKLQEELDEVWSKKRRKRLIPLRAPTLEDELDAPLQTAYLDMGSKKIKISGRFIEELSSSGATHKDLLDGVLEHELGHYFSFPGSLANILIEINTLKDVPSTQSNSIINYFNDIIDNSNIIIKDNDSTKAVAVVYKAMTKPDSSPADRLLAAYYTSIQSKYNFGASEDELDDDLKQKLMRLKTIDFVSTNKETIAQRLYRFYLIMRDLVEKEREDKNRIGFDDSAGYVKNATEEEKEKALKELSGFLDIEDYKYVYDILYDQNPPCDHDSTVSKALVDYYRHKASAYPIKINGIPLDNKEKAKEGLTEWNPSDGVKGINLLRSGGQFIPGVTKRWTDGTYTTHGTMKKIPDALIVIDSSGSMVNSLDGRSNAVLAAVSAALQYMKNGSKVDVINFSSSAIITKYKGSDSALEAIIDYQGEGTVFPAEEINHLLDTDNKDLVMITDGEVEEKYMDNFLENINRKSGQNRMSIVYINPPSMQSCQRFINKYKNIKFHFVDETEDIAKLVLGDITY